MTNLMAGLQALAAGDLNATAAYGTPKLQFDSHDEIGDPARSVNGIIDQSAAAIHAFAATSRRSTASSRERRT